ncbi:TonB-dependent receptor [Mucilaginibacter sabulilitoris]|uniref:TonB-dependent receptor n=1 Tax=Mucilaginibacter sabulilitoris TaxID=1173583 RepID=A0ABZ0THN8_9SPHI|nr:TonB-dependent receptor [Mucilaginibacter sabulilitoris]WPU92715.1 TonB-dependent receptor [Mucilaginibacter sabulilitoris]
MKKKMLYAVKHRMRKLQLTMRFTILFVFLFCLQLSAKVYSQKEITVKTDKKEVRLIRVFEMIENQSKYRFFYSNKEVPVNAPVQIKANGNVAIEDLLQSSLEKFGLNFNILPNDVIIIAPNNGKIVPIKIKGIIKDSKGVTLPGVSVKIKNVNKGTLTDQNGIFEIDAPEDAVLVFSFVGFQTQEIPVSGKSVLEVTLLDENKSLNEVVVVGYGTQKKSSTTAAISTVKGADIVNNPVANVTNSIAGRVPGISAVQGTGEPGADGATIRVRGIGTTQTGANASALTIVDGIPRAFSQINPNEIESITVLKDAAAVAPYGLAGANGVILITTKRGKEGKMSLSYNGWYGFQRPARFPDYLNAYDYATAYNQADKNAGLPEAYSADQLQKYKDHSDPDHYPDHDWIREVINFNAPMTSHNLTLSGGSDKVRFFTSIGYLYQEGSVNVINYSRYNLASNVDVNATKTTTVSLDVKASYEITKNPGATSGAGIYTSVTKNSPLLPNQLSFSNGLPGNTLLPSIYDSGYDKKDNNILFTQLSIEQKLPFIKGLAIKGVIAYDKGYIFDKNFQTPYTYYSLNASNQFIPVKAGLAAPSLSESFNQAVNTTLQGYITYQRTFGKNDINLLAVAEKRSGNNNLFGASRMNYQVDLDELSLGSSAKNDYDNSGSSNSSKQIGYVYRASYNYDQKYFAEFSGRYDGHYYFAPGKRFAFFPALSLGWRLSQESFIRDNYSWIDNLKLRGSIGKSGNLAGSAFQYLSSYGVNSSYVFGGTSYTQVQGAFERAQSNPDITWETSKKLDIGLEGLLFKGQLGFEFDVFKERRSDMLVPPTATVPLEYGIGLSQVNGGIMDNQGLDFSINHSHNFANGLSYNVGFNFSYAKNKLVQTFESGATYNNPNRRLTGRPLGTQFGFQAIGFFQSQDEINSSATQFGKLIPGDIKYKDQNGDGKIDDNDQVPIGKPIVPQIVYGLTGGIAWKGVDISMLWQGAAEGSYLLIDEAGAAFFNGAKIFKEQMNTWSPSNPNARYPILLPSPNTNSSQPSSLYISSGSYLRLKTAQIGYTFPLLLTGKIGIKSLRVFVSGQNLLTFSADNFIDPELGASGSTRSRYYFQQKVYSMGVNVNF